MKYIQTILWATLIMLATSACEDFIDIQPEDQIGVNEYFKTNNDIENYVKKYYTRFPAHGSANQPLMESNSDNLIVATPNVVLNGSRAPQTGRWINEWDDIRSVNILFDNIDRVEDPISSYAQFLGEAYFFRAWFYYDLLTTYGDVPIYESQLQPGDEALLDSRDPRNEVARFILSDIDKAISHLGHVINVGNSRLNKETALAFKTRVALFEGTWQKYHAGTIFGSQGADAGFFFAEAVSAAEELINGNYTTGIYNTGNPENDYYTLFGMDNMSGIDEVLFYRIANSAEQLGHELQFYTTRRTRNMSLTRSLISSYLDKNGKPYDLAEVEKSVKGNKFLSKIAADCDPRLHATIWIPGDLRVNSSGQLFDKPFLNGGSEELCATGYQVKKFSNPFSSGAGADFGGNSETGRIYFRFAEVLLNYAEAKYELDGTIAYEELNLLRRRVGMPDIEILPQEQFGQDVTHYGYQIDDALYAIRNERRVELALEGQRVNDYRRWAAHELFKGKRPLGYPFAPSEFLDFTPHLTTDGLIDYFKNDMPVGYGFRIDQDYLSSIPEDELSLNPNLEQNPGW